MKPTGTNSFTLNGSLACIAGRATKVDATPMNSVFPSGGAAAAAACREQAARARLIDHQSLLSPHLTELLGDDPQGHIRTESSSDRGDDLDRPCRGSLR